eukprot:gene4953-6170_t
MTTRKDDDVSMLLGKKLILGWTMLDVVCVKCVIVPLMEDKSNTGVIECVSCNRTFKRNQNRDLVEILDDINLSSNANNSNNNTLQSVPNETVIPQQQSIINPENVSTTTTTKSSSMDYLSDDDDDYEMTEEEKRLFELKIKKSDEFSQKMGEYLLLGWALLGEICPNKECFGVPLMRDREKRFYCVCCKRSGLKIEDLSDSNYKQQQQQQQQTEIHSSSSTPSINTNIGSPMKCEDEKETKNHVSTPLSKPPHQRNTVSSFSPPASEPIQKKQKKDRIIIENDDHHSFGESSSGCNQDLVYQQQQTLPFNSQGVLSELPIVTDKTIKTLCEKMKQLETKLSTGIGGSYLSIKQDCELIREYSDTLSSLLSLKKHWTQ